jgi:extradiol dioxygenase family protein
MVARVRESWFRAGRSQVQIREGKVDKSMAFHFALYVAPDAYEAFIEHLRAEKVRFNSEPRVFEDGFRRCTVFDPDDNMIEIADEKPA